LFGTNGLQEQQHFMYYRWCLCSPNYLCSPVKHQLAVKVVSTGNFHLLGCVTVLIRVSFPMLRRILVPSSSDSSIPITPHCLAVNMNVVQSFKTLGTTQGYIPEYLSLQQHQCCENLKSPIISTDSTITFSTTKKGQGRGVENSPNEQAYGDSCNSWNDETVRT